MPAVNYMMISGVAQSEEESKMADSERGFRGDRDRDRNRSRSGRRRDRGYRGQRGKGESSGSQPQPQAQLSTMKTPIILTKSSGDRGAEGMSKPIMIQTRDDRPVQIATPSGNLPQSSPVAAIITNPSRSIEEREITPSRDVPYREGLTTPASVASSPGIYHIQRTPSSTLASTPSGSSTLEAFSSNVSSLKILPAQYENPHCVKLVDESLQWSDSGLEMLTEQNDFLVVGVIGLQGVGKSTIMSLLAGNKLHSDSRSYLFKPQSKETQELSHHQTAGIDMVVTTERVILLDTQPLLSPSILDHLIHHDRNIPHDITSPENFMEIQSLQVTTFLFTVCHIVLVVQDWYTDLSFLRFLKTAEMLKPSAVTYASQDASGSASSDELDEYYPHLVFVYNKSEREEFLPENLEALHQTTDAVFQQSRLKIRDGVSLLGSDSIPYTNKQDKCTDVNIFVLPVNKQINNNNMVNGTSLLSDYQGHSSFQALMNVLRNQIFAVQRQPLTHHALSEKNWFHYAARSWEAVRKSNLISEYNRLLTS